MKKLIFSLALLTGGTSVARADAPATPNRLLVRFRGAESFLRSRSAQPLGHVSEHRRLGVSGLRSVRYSTALSPREAARRLREDPNVEWAQPDYRLSLPVQPSRILAPRLFPQLLAEPKKRPEVRSPKPLPNPPIEDAYLLPDLQWSLFQIEAPEAWKLQRGSHKILVADIDSGIDYSHVDLMNNRWGQIGYDFVAGDALPFDEFGHGTHTAGIIGAVGGNGKGVSGVSQLSTIMALNFIEADGRGTTAKAIQAIDYAIAHGARVINASWGGPADDELGNRALLEAVQRAAHAGVLMVAAAGNDASDNDQVPQYPAAFRLDTLISVGASNKIDDLSYFSNYGKKSVDVVAPGENIWSTIPYDQYAELNGTSMATPYVTGLAALLLAERPQLTPTQLKRVILETADPFPSLEPYVVTGARINVRKALARVRAAP